MADDWFDGKVGGGGGGRRGGKKNQKEDRAAFLARTQAQRLSRQVHLPRKRVPACCMQGAEAQTRSAIRERLACWRPCAKRADRCAILSITKRRRLPR